MLAKGEAAGVGTGVGGRGLGGRARAAQREAEQAGAQPCHQRAEQPDGEHEEHDDAEGGAGRVVPGGAGGHAGEDRAYDEGADAEEGTDQAGPQPLNRRVRQRLSGLGLRGPAPGRPACAERGEQPHDDGGEQRKPADVQVHGARDGAPVLELPEPPVGEPDAGQAADDPGERRDEQCFGGDRAAGLPRGGADGAQQGELAGPLTDRERDGSGGREDRDDGGDAAEGAADSEERHLGVPEARVLDGTAVVVGVALDAGAGQGLLHGAGEGVGVGAVLRRHDDGGGLGVGEPRQGTRVAGVAGGLRGAGLGDAGDAEVLPAGGGLQYDGVADRGVRGAGRSRVEDDFPLAGCGAGGQRGAGERVRAPSVRGEHTARNSQCTGAGVRRALPLAPA